MNEFMELTQIALVRDCFLAVIPPKKTPLSSKQKRHQTKIFVAFVFFFFKTKIPVNLEANDEDIINKFHSCIKFLSGKPQPLGRQLILSFSHKVQSKVHVSIVTQAYLIHTTFSN